MAVTLEDEAGKINNRNLHLAYNTWKVLIVRGRGWILVLPQIIRKKGINNCDYKGKKLRYTKSILSVLVTVRSGFTLSV